MIFDFIKEKRIIKMPHQERWNAMMKRLSDDQYQAIYDEINSKIFFLFYKYKNRQN